MTLRSYRTVGESVYHMTSLQRLKRILEEGILPHDPYVNSSSRLPFKIELSYPLIYSKRPILPHIVIRRIKPRVYVGTTPFACMPADSAPQEDGQILLEISTSVMGKPSLEIPRSLPPEAKREARDSGAYLEFVYRKRVPLKAIVNAYFDSTEQHATEIENILVAHGANARPVSKRVWEIDVVDLSR